MLASPCRCGPRSGALPKGAGGRPACARRATSSVKAPGRNRTVRFRPPGAGLHFFLHPSDHAQEIGAIGVEQAPGAVRALGQGGEFELGGKRSAVQPFGTGRLGFEMRVEMLLKGRETALEPEAVLVDAIGFGQEGLARRVREIGGTFASRSRLIFSRWVLIRSISRRSRKSHCCRTSTTLRSHFVFTRSSRSQALAPHGFVTGSTKKTTSATGMNDSASGPCPPSIELVPGVSTSSKSRRKLTGR